MFLMAALLLFVGLWLVIGCFVCVLFAWFRMFAYDALVF